MKKKYVFNKGKSEEQFYAVERATQRGVYDILNTKKQCLDTLVARNVDENFESGKWIEVKVDD